MRRRARAGTFPVGPLARPALLWSIAQSAETCERNGSPSAGRLFPRGAAVPQVTRAPALAGRAAGRYGRIVPLAPSARIEHAVGAIGTIGSAPGWPAARSQPPKALSTAWPTSGLPDR